MESNQNREGVNGIQGLFSPLPALSGERGGRAGAALPCPSPLVGEGGARSAPDEGSLSASPTGRLPRGERPLTRLRFAKPPSPTRGEGEAITASSRRAAGSP